MSGLAIQEQADVVRTCTETFALDDDQRLRTFSTPVQVCAYGTTPKFTDKDAFRQYMNANYKNVQKISYGSDVDRSIWRRVTITPALQKVVCKNHCLFFPVGTNVFLNIPFCFSDETMSKAVHYMEKYGIDSAEAQLCACVKGAILSNFFEQWLLDTL
jgi:hypothetical protein